MYKECKSPSSSKRQEEIAHCFSEILNEMPYENITITQLCKRINIPRNTLYRYFTGKEAILQYLLEDTLIKLLKASIQIEGKKTSNITEHLAYWLKNYRQYDHLWSLVYYGEKHNMMITQMIKYYVKLADPSFKEDFNNLQTKQIIFLAYGLQGILDVWKHTGYEQSEKEVAKQLYKLFQTPMLDIQPTAKQALALISKHNDDNYIFTEYKAIHNG